uniref:ComF family protein n=1 Tax=candidate division CPR3 bacterium TaxID=2268181 RepID=A0A7V3JAM6_UNCC3
MLGFLLDFFFPKKCVGCGKEGIWLCKDCYAQILLKGLPFIRLTGDLDGVVCGSVFEGILREAIHVFKYEGVKELATPLSRLLAQRFRETGLDFGRVSLIPVPLSKRKELERGFNQAGLLAEAVGKKLGFGVLAGVLIKTKDTVSQTELKGEERKENVKGSFDFVGEKRLVKGKVLCLVDDVMTTGSTLNECARVLKKAGAKAVWGLVVAKGSS